MQDITIDIHSYPEQRHPTGHHGQINFREVEKKMEGTVTMTLSDYDELKYQIRRHEQKAVDAQLALANLKNIQV